MEDELSELLPVMECEGVEKVVDIHQVGFLQMHFLSLTFILGLASFAKGTVVQEDLCPRDISPRKHWSKVQV